MPALIIVSHVYPPVPSRDFDYCAHRDGNDECGPFGWGRSEDEAVQSLMDREADQ